MGANLVRGVVFRTCPNLCIAISSYYDVSSSFRSLLCYVCERVVYVLQVGVVVAAVWKVSSRQMHVYIFLRKVHIRYSFTDGYKHLHEWSPAFMEPCVLSFIMVVKWLIKVWGWITILVPTFLFLDFYPKLDLGPLIFTEIR